MRKEYIRSFSIPVPVTTFAKTHPIRDASSAIVESSTVLPEPLGLRKMVARLGSPGPSARPSTTSSMSSSLPAKANGSCPNVGVNGLRPLFTHRLSPTARPARGGITHGSYTSAG